MTTALARLRTPFRYDIARHDVRSQMPAAIQAIMQNGLLDRAFEDALMPDLLYPALATPRPWRANLGDTQTFTRPGLLVPTTTPITGSDPGTATYGVEQFSMTMDQYANSMDTNMLISSMTIQSKFLQDIKTLGQNAGQSVSRLARQRLYNAYAGGNTWVVTAQGSASATCVVKNAAGFSTVLVNGVPTAVSGANPLTVTVAGSANTVTGVNLGTNTLTLGTAVTQAVGAQVVASNAPYSLRPNSRATRYNLTGSDVATSALFRAAVARLRNMGVPTINGVYVAHIDPDTESQLFADTEFQNAARGAIASPVYRELSLGIFLGIDWVRNNDSPTTTDGGSSGTLKVHQPLVMGGDALLSGPFENMAELLRGTGVEDVPNISMIGPAEGVQVAMIIRPPQDKLQQVVSSTWSYVGDFGVPTDVTGMNDPALYKRGVLIEHA